MIEVKSEIDSVVTQYEVEDGERVQAGDNVMMLEVMKMQNYVESPVSGRIRFVAQLGDTVAAGDLLFTVEEDTHG